MLTYLADGWFSRTQPQRFNTAVLDGVLDSAGLLTRAGVSHEALLALRARLLQLGGPPSGPGEDARSGGHYGAPSNRERQQLLGDHIADRTDGCLALQSFMADCLESAEDPRSLQALCAHLEHISQAMALLQAARTVRPSETVIPHRATDAQTAQDRVLRAPRNQAARS